MVQGICISLSFIEHENLLYDVMHECLTPSSSGYPTSTILKAKLFIIERDSIT